MTMFRFRLGAVAAVALPYALGAAGSSPEVLQAQGFARLERSRDQFRRNGVDASLLTQLETAANELSLSYRGFAVVSNFAQAAWSLIRLAEIERQTALFYRVLPAAQAQNGSQRADTLAHSARDHYKEAASLARRMGTNFYLVKALTGWALVQEDQFHDYGSANTLVTEAMRAASSCPDPQACRLEALEAKVRLETGRGELFSAASHVNGLLALMRRGSDPAMEYSVYSDRSDIYRAFADSCSTTLEQSPDICYRLFDLAKADLVKARDIAEQAGFSYFVSLTRERIQGLDVLRSLTEKNISFRGGIPTDLYHPKTSKDVLAAEILPLGQIPSQALEWGKELIKSAGPGLPGAPRTYIQAEFDDAQGRADAALEGYLRAIHIVEEDRQRVGDSSARSSFLDDKIYYYERPTLMLLRNSRYAEAFDLIESTRARVTADLVSTRSLRASRVDRKLFATLALKKGEIASLQSHFFNDIFSPDTSSEDAETVAKAQTHLTELEQEYEQLLLTAARNAPQAQQLAISPRPSLAAVQSVLHQDSADLLYFYLIESAVILIHIGPDSVHVRNIVLPRVELKRKVTDLLNSMRKQDTPFRDDLAKELFLYLIQPAVAWLHSDRLVVIPQGELESLPFQALQDPANGAFAGERFLITYAPSASIFVQLKKNRNLAGATLLAAADPSLPGAPEEVRTLARLFSGRQKALTDSLIRKNDLMQWAGSYNIVHLAVHGKFDAQEPLLSYVNLAAGPGEDGNLTAAEMFSLPLDNARLVTLSACESGRVRTTRANDIQGIQQALLFAGAQSLLVSTWKVDSESTARWMQIFYREAQTKTSPEAAREAIRGMRRVSEFSHPHFWAPFLLIAR
jgi:CHAT domain-containing protein